jgi:hypothetical protein
MVDMDRQTQGPVPLKKGNGFAAYPGGIGNRNPCADPEEYPRPNTSQGLKKLFQTGIVRR